MGDCNRGEHDHRKKNQKNNEKRISTSSENNEYKVNVIKLMV